MAEYKNLREDMKCNYTSSLYIYIYAWRNLLIEKSLHWEGRLGEQQGVLAKMKTSFLRSFY